MPRVPTLNPQVGQEPSPVSRANFSPSGITSSAFGIGDTGEGRSLSFPSITGMEGFAAGMQQAGANIEKAFLELDRRQKMLNLRKFDSEMSSGIRTLMYGDPTTGAEGFLNIRNEDAVDAHIPMREQAKKIYEDLLKKAEEAGVGNEFLEAGLARLNNSYMTMAKHSAQELRNAEKYARGATIENAVNDAGVDASLLDRSLGVIKGTVEEMLEDEGRSDPEDVKRTLRLEESKAVVSAVNGLISRNDWAQASKVLQDYGEHMDPAARSRAMASVTANAQDELKFSLVRQIQRMYPNDIKAQQKWVNKNVNNAKLAHGVIQLAMNGWRQDNAVNDYIQNKFIRQQQAAQQQTEGESEQRVQQGFVSIINMGNDPIPDESDPLSGDETFNPITDKLHRIKDITRAEGMLANMNLPYKEKQEILKLLNDSHDAYTKAQEVKADNAISDVMNQLGNGVSVNSSFAMNPGARELIMSHGPEGGVDRLYKMERSLWKAANRANVPNSENMEETNRLANLHPLELMEVDMRMYSGFLTEEQFNQIENLKTAYRHIMHRDNHPQFASLERYLLKTYAEPLKMSEMAQNGNEDALRYMRNFRRVVATAFYNYKLIHGKPPGKIEEMEIADQIMATQNIPVDVRRDNIFSRLLGRKTIAYGESNRLQRATGEIHPEAMSGPLIQSAIQVLQSGPKYAGHKEFDDDLLEQVAFALIDFDFDRLEELTGIPVEQWEANQRGAPRGGASIAQSDIDLENQVGWDPIINLFRDFGAPDYSALRIPIARGSGVNKLPLGVGPVGAADFRRAGNVGGRPAPDTVKQEVE